MPGEVIGRHYGKEDSEDEDSDDDEEKEMMIWQICNILDVEMKYDED